MAMSPQDPDRRETLREILRAAERAAEELQQDNAMLRRRLTELEAHLLEARAQQGEPGADGSLRPAFEAEFVPDDGAPEAEHRSSVLEKQLEQLSGEYAELERQNSNYLSLYVASSQIHATLVFEDVVRIIKEIIINLIGADRFAIYLYQDSVREFRRAACEGQLDAADEVIPFGDNLLSRVVQAREPCLRIDHSDLPSGAMPLALLPLLVGEDPVGVVVLFRLLVQKEGFDAFDMELFGLLTAHAATALMSSLRYRRLERRANTLQGLLDLFKNPSGAADVTEG